LVRGIVDSDLGSTGITHQKIVDMHVCGISTAIVDCSADGMGVLKSGRPINSGIFSDIRAGKICHHYQTSDIGKFKYKLQRVNVVKTMKISARNQIPGTVRMIKKGPVSTEVIITIAGGGEIASSITTQSAEKLNLREGGKVYAIVKASDVMVGID
jgi:molybdopterin-binding protein